MDDRQPATPPAPATFWDAILAVIRKLDHPALVFGFEVALILFGVSRVNSS